MEHVQSWQEVPQSRIDICGVHEGSMERGTYFLQQGNELVPAFQPEQEAVRKPGCQTQHQHLFNGFHGKHADKLLCKQQIQR